MKKFICTFLVIIVVSSFSFAQNENLYKNSVGACLTIYGIYYNSKGKPENFSIGTGFFISPITEGIFCTALHVVKGANEVVIDYGYEPGIISNDLINPTKIFPLETKKKYYWIDESRDLIIFKLSGLNPSTSLSINSILPSQGESVNTIGNTFGDYTMKLSTGQISQIIQGNLMKWIISEFTGLGGGNSGGPVFNKNGEVIGLIDAQDRRNNTIIWIVPALYIDYVIQEIKTRGEYSDIDKQINDMILTPDIYSDLKPYDENRFKKVK